MYVCDRCGSRFHSARAASLELCPRCLLRDDAAAPLRHDLDARRAVVDRGAATPSAKPEREAP